MSQQPEPKDITKYNAIWHTAIVDGERVKLYSLTRYSMDKLENVPTHQDLVKLRKQYDDLINVLRPILVSNLKQELLKVMETTNHRSRTLLMRVPYGNFYSEELALEALSELVSEGKAVEVKWGWHKKEDKK